MSGLMCRTAARHGRGERGAAATLVAVLLAGGVLLGMTALVVDVGQLYAEREELLSGADAAAFAIALDCAKDRAACDDLAAQGTAGTYAGENARDGVSNAVVCGNDPEGRLQPCTEDPTGNLTDCLNERPTDIAYVEVRTTTRLPDGSTLLPPSFAQTLVSGYNGTTVGACSRVGWGAPAGGLAVTFSRCEWEGATANGTDFPPAGASNETLRDYEVIVFTQNTDGDADCFNGPPHFDGPGGFGWLDDPDSECVTEIGEDDTYQGGTGTDPPPTQCQDLIRALRLSGTPVAVPIFHDVRPDPPGLEYDFEGFAAFVITGYRLSGNPTLNEDSILDSGRSCSGSDRCLIGYFTQELVSGPIGSGPSLGAVVVKTIG
jgi:hypothetical protein